MAPWMGWDAPSAGLSSPLNSSFEVQGMFRFRWILHCVASEACSEVLRTTGISGNVKLVM